MNYMTSVALKFKMAFGVKMVKPSKSQNEIRAQLPKWSRGHLGPMLVMTNYPYGLGLTWFRRYLEPMLFWNSCGSDNIWNPCGSEQHLGPCGSDDIRGPFGSDDIRGLCGSDDIRGPIWFRWCLSPLVKMTFLRPMWFMIFEVYGRYADVIQNISCRIVLSMKL